MVGPEAPLIALGGGLGFLIVRSIRRDAPPQLGTLLASSGTFAAMSFLFGSPIIAAVILIEAAGLGGSRMPLVLIPGLLAAGIGSLVSIGMGVVDRAQHQPTSRSARCTCPPLRDPISSTSSGRSRSRP